MTGKRILITGGSGTLGYNVLKLLANSTDYAITASVRGRKPKLIEFENRIDFVEHELSDPVHTAQMFGRANPDIIIHCAASGLRPPKGSWFDLMQFNVESTMRLFQMNCRLNHKSRFIYISTGLVYREQGRPLSESDPIETLHPYGASKAAGDSMLQAASAEFHRPLTIIRPFAFTGEHDGGGRLFPRILEGIVNRSPIPLTEGRQVRDFCSVDDIAQAVLSCVHHQQVGLIEKFNVGSGRALPLRALIEEVCRELGVAPELDFGAVKMNPHEPFHSVADVSHARDVLGWIPKHRLSHAVWQLARTTHPELQLKEPPQLAESI